MLWIEIGHIQGNGRWANIWLQDVAAHAIRCEYISGEIKEDNAESNNTSTHNPRKLSTLDNRRH